MLEIQNKKQIITNKYYLGTDEADFRYMNFYTFYDLSKYRFNFSFSYEISNNCTNKLNK